MPQGVATTRNHLRRFAVLIGMQDNTVQLRETRHAFDSVAADYDGPRGNNALIQRMRRTLWEVVHRELPSGSRLLDLGCGTGIDRSEEHTYELQSLMRISYAVFCLKK